MKITQLSDCAFIWSENILDVIIFCSKFMHQAIDSGILCRGGLAYGEIIETNQSHELGRFILGNAVTQAVNLEKLAKGCRILINVELPMEFKEQNSGTSDMLFSLFQPFTNPLDFTVYDEFKWYVAPELDMANLVDLNLLSFPNKVLFTKGRLKLASRLRCSPKFGWNSLSEAGLVQLRSSISFLSENYLLGIMHIFNWSDVYIRRSEKQVNDFANLIDAYSDYRIYKPVPFPTDCAPN